MFWCIRFTVDGHWRQTRSRLAVWILKLVISSISLLAHGSFLNLENFIRSYLSLLVNHLINA